VRPACSCGTLEVVRQPQLKSTFARAVVPVAAGIAFFAVLGLALWGVAALSSRNTDQVTSNLSPTVQEMGSAANLARIIAEDGPIVMNDLIGDDDHIVLSHTGDDPSSNWTLHLAHPADRPPTCTVEVVKQTQTFTDCDGRTLTVDDLAEVPPGVYPVYNKDEGTLTLDLTPTPSTSVAPSTTTG
jgi:hypothetical protein